MKPIIITGEDCHEEAKRRAIKGHRDWIVWRGRDGTKRAAPMRESALRQALLDLGTQGKGIMYNRNDAVPWGFGWTLGTIWLQRLKAGTYI